MRRRRRRRLAFYWFCRSMRGGCAHRSSVVWMQVAQSIGYELGLAGPQFGPMANSLFDHESTQWSLRPGVCFTSVGLNMDAKLSARRSL